MSNFTNVHPFDDTAAFTPELVEERTVTLPWLDDHLGVSVATLATLFSPDHVDHVMSQFAALEQRGLPPQVAGHLAFEVRLPRAPQYIRDASLDGPALADAAWRADPVMMLDMAWLAQAEEDSPLAAMDAALEWLVYDSPVVDSLGTVHFITPTVPALDDERMAWLAAVMNTLSYSAFYGPKGRRQRVEAWQIARNWLHDSLAFRAELGSDDDTLAREVHRFIAQVDARIADLSRERSA